jgi:ribosomal protein S18 acetylase RimI-like enzyme
MEPIEIRVARVDDTPAMEDVFRSASLSNAGDRAALLEHPEALQLAEELAASGRALVATSTDGTIVGFASTRPTGSGVAELDDLFVDPEWMRRGVARALMQSIGARAPDEGVIRVEVTANEHALDFYRAVGFVIDGRADTEFGSGLRMHLDVGRS